MQIWRQTTFHLPQVPLCGLFGRAEFPGLLEHNTNRDPVTRIVAIVEVIPVVIANVNVVGSVPVFGPSLRPRVHQHEPESAVLEARIPTYDNGTAANAKPVLASEIERESFLGNIVTTIAAALSPSAMLNLPVLRSILLPRAVPLPTAALVKPSALLLPTGCLLLGALRYDIGHLPLWRPSDLLRSLRLLLCLTGRLLRSFRLLLCRLGLLLLLRSLRLLLCGSSLRLGALRLLLRGAALLLWLLWLLLRRSSPRLGALRLLLRGSGLLLWLRSLRLLLRRPARLLALLLWLWMLRLLSLFLLLCIGSGSGDKHEEEPRFDQFPR
jgi:hypothetical protein